ncbi:MAG TPA: Ltp family lipoprotein [Candidatus Flavonifractor intestinipullorum]|uniref:Ltp family lipoprotein n=1 Tax=Candidatus Flavonifractor intestinipullorum TaxID=2838587 RepID=A0A9D2M9Z5_9FIRM|nr:Ltp family lipoprotein [Candidatus Flavonifractor intestinipullorum]
MDLLALSRDELLSQLEYEGFTTEQALYGVAAVGY